LRNPKGSTAVSKTPYKKLQSVTVGRNLRQKQGQLPLDTDQGSVVMSKLPFRGYMIFGTILYREVKVLGKGKKQA